MYLSTKVLKYVLKYIFGILVLVLEYFEACTWHLITFRYL